MKKFERLFFCLISIGLSHTISAQLVIENYALEHVHVVDVVNNKIWKDYTVVVNNDKIQDLFSSSNYIQNDSVQSFNFKEKYLIPGLIDAHVHMATDPTKERREDAEHTLKEMLLSGITSVRDMAGDARALASLSRDALVGDIDAPNVYFSSLMAGPEFFTDPRTIATAQGGVSGQMPYMKAIDDATNISLAVAEAKGAGAHGLKLYANLTAAQMKAIVKEAKQQNFPAWAHAALMPTKPSEVIESGVISISHSSMLILEKFAGNKEIPEAWMEVDLTKDNSEYWEEEYQKLQLQNLYQQIKKQAVILDATMSLKGVYENNPKRHWRYEMSKRITRDAKNAGVKVCAGSDTDQITFVQHEMKLLVNDCEFSPYEALEAATLHAAEATGIAASEGSIEKGKTANLVLLNKNPLEAIENIDAVHMVIKYGRMYSK